MLKPEDVLPLNEAQQKQYHNFEAAIDMLLIKNPYGITLDGMSTPSLWDLRGSGKVWERLECEYEKNGWKFTYKGPDAANGDTIAGGSLRIHPKNL